MSVVEAADHFWRVERRRYYVTPRSFLELLRLAETMLSSGRAELQMQLSWYSSGVEKLNEASCRPRVTLPTRARPVVCAAYALPGANPRTADQRACGSDAR